MVTGCAVPTQPFGNSPKTRKIFSFYSSPVIFISDWYPRSKIYGEILHQVRTQFRINIFYTIMRKEKSMSTYSQVAS